MYPTLFSVQNMNKVTILSEKLKLMPLFIIYLSGSNAAFTFNHL